MKQSATFAVLLFLSIPSTLHAQETWREKLVEAVKTHRLVILAAAGMFAVQSLNAVTTLQAEERDPQGVDFGFFGRHPSHAGVWAGTQMFAVSGTAFSLLAYRFAPDKYGKKFVTALWSVPLTVSGLADIDDNVNTPRVHAARARVLRLNTGT